MATLMPWNTVEIGDLDLFTPAIPSLVVYTWYVNDEPESSVTYFWSDEDTGDILQELVLVGPVTFDEAVTHAQNEAPKRNVKRIHVKNARTTKQSAVKQPAEAKAAGPRTGARVAAPKAKAGTAARQGKSAAKAKSPRAASSAAKRK